MQRHKFIVKAGGVLATATAGTRIVDAPTSSPSKSSSGACPRRGPQPWTSLERGVIDSTEWVGPHDDMKLGLHNAARYYYLGWHKPGMTAEFGFEKKAYESLLVDLRHMIDEACAAVQVYGLMGYDAENVLALQKLRTDFEA